MKKKVLIGSPIHQKPEILKCFLSSLKRLNIDNIDLHYLFIDDNEDKNSKEVLRNFSNTEKNVNILESGRQDRYIRNENTHIWDESLIWKVANYKNVIIQVANDNNCDFLFLIDSDLVLHPYTLQQLIASEKDIISNIFWTKWKPNLPELPQVWMFDSYEQYSQKRGERLAEDEKNRRTIDFINKLKSPGVFEVGGLGACTLLSRKAITEGVNFNEIKNVSFWGEDRHFCIRAHALGFDLFVDTHFPAYHIYRESDLVGVENYIIKTSTSLPHHDINRIITTTINGIEGLGSSVEGAYWESYFTTDFLKTINTKNQIENQTDHIIKAEVNDLVIKRVENHQKLVVVEFLLTNRDKYNDQVIYDKLSCNAILVKQDENWKINEIIIVENQMITPEKNRGLEKEKRKVSIVYTNYSGSNAIALYKLFPECYKKLFDIELVKQKNSQDYLYNLLASDIVITTEGNYPFLDKKHHENQKVIDLWHGFPLKAMGYADNSDHLIGRIGPTWSNVDYITSYSPLFNSSMNKCIRTDTSKYVITGAPRNDLLFGNNGKGSLSQLFNKDLSEKKCVIYMPTFRISQMKKVNEGKKSWENIFDFDHFNNEEFQFFLKEKNIELFVKLHPAEERNFISSVNKFNYVNLITNDLLEENELDLYEILGGFDLLVTDYSSVYFDFLLLNKPIIFTPTDIEKYKEARGLLFDYEIMTPGPKVTTQSSLQIEIEKSLFEQDYFHVERENIKEKVHCFKDNNSSQRVWEFISEL